MHAFASFDVFVAKAKLGILLGGVTPIVGSEGVIRCRNARHPILVLRNAEKENIVAKETRYGLSIKKKVKENIRSVQSNVQIDTTDTPAHSVGVDTGASTPGSVVVGVVGNDLSLNASSAALVISGPNAGGTL